jgi:hypothetical protein
MLLRLERSLLHLVPNVSKVYERSGELCGCVWIGAEMTSSTDAGEDVCRGCPSLRDQHLSVMLGQIDEIPDAAS